MPSSLCVSFKAILRPHLRHEGRVSFCVHGVEFRLFGNGVAGDPTNALSFVHGFAAKGRSHRDK